MDYTAIIRDQIIRDVESLHVSQKRGHLDHASFVKIGYLINSHKGLPIFSEGDMIDGLEVHIGHRDKMDISVGRATSHW